MSATPEQIAIDEKALEAAATTVVIDHTIAAHRARAIARTAVEAYLTATKDAQAERMRVLEAKLEKIAGEAPAKEPPNYVTVAWPPSWSEDLRDTVNDMIQQAFNEGHTRACWELGQIADKALKTEAA